VAIVSTSAWGCAATSASTARRGRVTRRPAARRSSAACSMCCTSDSWI